METELHFCIHLAVLILKKWIEDKWNCQIPFKKCYICNHLIAYIFMIADFIYEQILRKNLNLFFSYIGISRWFLLYKQGNKKLVTKFASLGPKAH